MKISKTKFKDLLVFKSKNFYDNRGYFREVLIEKLIKKRFKFIVVSKSKRNVLRGLHMQTKFQQGKFISVLKGKIFDVVIDLRKNSKTFGRVARPTIPFTSCVSLIFFISSEDWSTTVTEWPWAESCLLIEKPTLPAPQIIIFILV